MTLLDYVARKVGCFPEHIVGETPYEALAVLRAGRAAGAVILMNFRGSSIEMCWAGEPGWATRGVLSNIFGYPFLQLGCFRVNGIVERSNKASREFARRLGCREVGILEDEFGLGRDAVLYTMARKNCRWLKDGANGQEKRTKAAGPLQGRGGADEIQHRDGPRASPFGNDGADKRFWLN